MSGQWEQSQGSGAPAEHHHHHQERMRSKSISNRPGTVLHAIEGAIGSFDSNHHSHHLHGGQDSAEKQKRLSEDYYHFDPTVGLDHEHEVVRHRVLCCWLSGNGVSLLTCAILFATITAVQYYFGAVVTHSLALQADCVSMGVDAISFLGNLIASDCVTNPAMKRPFELAMSGFSHCLLLGFTISFILEAVEDAQTTDDDDSVNGWIVMGFALGGLAFDTASLATYYYCGERKEVGDGDPYKEDLLASDEDKLVGATEEDALTCGINTNMCAALLHVFSDLARSTTTLIESIVILEVKSISSTQADGVSALIVCSIIAIGATVALFTWMREVKVFLDLRHAKANAAAGSFQRVSDN